jgi:hypothetical protein
MFKLPRFSFLFGVYAALTVLTVFAGQCARISYLKSDRDRIAVSEDSTIAANDSTHAAVVDSITTSFTRRVVQTELAKSALNKKLHTESKLRANAEVRIKRLTLSLDSSLAQTDSSYKAEFVGTKPPFDTLYVGVEVIPARNAAKWSVEASFRPFHLNADLQCGKPLNGIHPATLNVTGPSWMTISLDTIKQSKSICNPGVRVVQSHSGRKYIIGAVVGGALVGSAVHFLHSKEK